MYELRRKIKLQEEQISLNAQAKEEEKDNLNAKYVGLIENERKESSKLVTKLSAQKEENAKS